MSIAPLYQIMTNLNCNLDCHYCYEQKTGKQNTVGNVRTFLTGLFKRDEGNTGPVLIDLIGGEPVRLPRKPALSAKDVRTRSNWRGSVDNFKAETNFEV